MNREVATRLSADLIEQAIAWRRHLHQHPELAFDERRTADFVAAHLGGWGYAVHRGLGGTGVVGTLKRGTGRRAIGIRADMDALPILEQSGVAHESTARGLMHACGHDGHVAIALAAARVCADLPNLDGTVHFIFQPAEEREGGAARMIREGLFRLFPCDTIYGLHNWPGLPVGTCVARDGPMMAAIADFEIVINGRGCHGAMPHEGIDPIVAGCQLVASLQTISSRSVDPMKTAVVSVAAIHAGEAFNVIPDSCRMRGSTRWFDEDVGEILERRLTQLSTSVAAAFGCEALVRYQQLYPPTINDPSAAAFVRDLARAAELNVADVRPSMASEDFAVMLQAIPGCYLWLGSGTSQHGLHSARYDFNDAIVPLGAALWVELVRRSLAAA
jgi:amidohydrolase